MLQSTPIVARRLALFSNMEHNRGSKEERGGLTMSPSSKYAKTQRARTFLKSEEGIAAYQELLKMVEDDSYNTESTFSPSHSEGNLPFIDKHMEYLCNHLNVKTEHYLSNLRLITRVRP